RRPLSIARRRLRSDRRGFIVVGYVAAEGDDTSVLGSDDKLSGGDLLQLCRRYQVDEIVVAMDDRRRRFPMDELLECRLEGLEIVELVSFLGAGRGKGGFAGHR